MNNEQFERATERLGELLAEMGWDPERTQAGVFTVDLGPPHLPVSTAFAAILRDTGQFVLYLNFGISIPPEKRDETLRLIARANWDLIVGNFELDLDDGHLRFKSSLDFDGVELSEPLIRNAVLGAMRAVEAHAAALMSVARA